MRSLGQIIREQKLATLCEYVRAVQSGNETLAKKIRRANPEITAAEFTHAVQNGG